MRTNEYLVTLTLNETGRKAVGAYTKVLTILSEDGNVTKEMIEDVFPLSLVESYDIQKSFGNLDKGDYVVYESPDGTKHLGTVSHWYSNKCVVYSVCLDGYHHDSIEFNKNGVEATHRKDKNILVWETMENIEKMIRSIENRKLSELLDLLNEGGADIKYRAENLTLPKWLTQENVEMLLRQLHDWKECGDMEL